MSPARLLALLSRPRTVVILTVTSIVLAPLLVHALYAPDVPTWLRTVAYAVTPLALVAYAAGIVGSIYLTRRLSASRRARATRP